MTAIGVIGIAVAALLTLVLVCGTARGLYRSGDNKAYDERQLIEQGRARAVANTVEAVYFGLLTAYLIHMEFGGKQTLPPSLLIFIGLLLQIMTYHIYCVMTHAALPFGENPKATIFWLTAAGLVQFGNFCTNHRTPPLWAPGDTGIGVLNLAAGTAFFFLALLHLICLLRKERE